MQNIFRENKRDIQFFQGGNPNFPSHIHEDIEILYMEKGSGYAYCDENLYRLNEGDFFLVFPNQIHYYSEFGLDSRCNLIIVNPGLLTLSNLFSEKKPLSAKYESGKQDKNLMMIFNIIFDEFNKNSSKNIICSTITAFLTMLIDKSEMANINVNRSCGHKIINYCRKHYKEELNIEKLSKELHISRSHISHTFNNKLKISFPDYINSLRLNSAVKMLDKREGSITEIAQMSGFQTVRSFNRVFNKNFGISPTEYLKSKRL